MNVVVRMLKQHHDVSAIVYGRDRSPVRVCGAFAMFFLVACVAVGMGARLRFASDVQGMCGLFVVVVTEPTPEDAAELGGGSSGNSGSGSSGLCVCTTIVVTVSSLDAQPAWAPCRGVTGATPTPLATARTLAFRRGVRCESAVDVSEWVVDVCH